MGTVCRKHEEFYEDRCRWCVEPAKAVEVPAVAAPVFMFGHPMLIAQQPIATAANASPMSWGFTPHDYGSDFICKRCAHHFFSNGQPSCPVSP